MLAAAALKFFYVQIMKKPFAEVKMPKKDSRLPTVLTKEEVKTLIDSADTEKSRLIMSLLYSSGLRVSELVNLKVDDVTLPTRSGWVRRGKGAKDRIFMISEQLSQNIYSYLQGRENTYIFSKEKPLTTRNIQKIIKNAGKSRKKH